MTKPKPRPTNIDVPIFERRPMKIIPCFRDVVTGMLVRDLNRSAHQVGDTVLWSAITVPDSFPVVVSDADLEQDTCYYIEPGVNIIGKDSAKFISAMLSELSEQLESAVSVDVNVPEFVLDFLTAGAAYLRSDFERNDQCDHSAGVCFCEQMSTVTEVESFLKAYREVTRNDKPTA